MGNLSLSPEMALFMAGTISGLPLTVLVLVPLFYGFPHSLLWVVRGWAKWYAPLLYVISPLVWGLAFLGAWIVLILYVPDVRRYLLSSRSFVIGQAVGAIWVLARTALSKYAQDRTRDKFIKLMYPRLTDVGQAEVIKRCWLWLADSLRRDASGVLRLGLHTHCF